MTWSEAWKSVFGSMIDYAIQASARMLVQWLTDRAYELIYGKTTRSAEITGGAAVAAVNAMGSVAAIPYYGWAMAPGVASSTFSQALAYLPSAAQGWDRVPADTMAMIHKDEMVMSAPLAEGIRSLVKERGAGGAGGSGPVNVHFHGVVDADAFWKKNQGHILKTLGDAATSRRVR